MSKVAVLDPLVAQQVAAGEVVDRLIYLPIHKRYTEEIDQGFHDKKTKKGKARKQAKSKADSVTAYFFGEEA